MSSVLPRKGTTKHCIYAGCKIDSRYGPQVGFMAFPKPCLAARKQVVDPTSNKHLRDCQPCRLCSRWVYMCKRKDGKFSNIHHVKYHTYICKNHFVDEQGPTEMYPDPLPFAEVLRIRKSVKYRKLRRRADDSDLAATSSTSTSMTADASDNFVDMTKLLPLMDASASDPSDPLHTYMDMDDVKPLPIVKMEEDADEDEDVKPILLPNPASNSTADSSADYSSDIIELNFHNYAKNIRTLAGSPLVAPNLAAPPLVAPNLAAPPLVAPHLTALPSVAPNPAITNASDLRPPPQPMDTSAAAPRPIQKNYFLIQTVARPAKLMVDRSTGTDSQTYPNRNNSSQTTFVHKEMVVLRDENARLKQEASALKNELMLNEMRRVKNPQSVTAFVDSLRDNDKKCKFYTGFHFDQIERLFDVLSPLDDMVYWGTKRPTNQTRMKKLTPIEELTLTLLRLRTGLMMQDLSYRFNVSMGSITRIVNTWIQHASAKFNFMRFDMAGAKREIAGKNLPVAFNWSKDVNVVMECAEFLSEKVVRPPPQQQSTPFCPKAHTTFKVLLGCTHPNGAVVFVSDVFHGSLSDEEMVEESKLRDLAERGDFVLTNGSFAITKHLTSGGSKKNPFNTRRRVGRRHTTAEKDEEEEEEEEDEDEEEEEEDEEEVEADEEEQEQDVRKEKEKQQTETKGNVETKSVTAEEKLHYKHVVGRLKEFKLLQKVLPFSMSATLSQLIFVCACLLNFQEPLLKKMGNT